MSVRDATPDELADWDARAVDAPGGHVYQSRAWAEHRRASGWTPRFLVTDDAGRTLALTRSWSVLPGGSAYVPRGPGPVATDGALLGSRLAAIGLALAEDHIDVVAADPEVPAADAGYRATIEAAGFQPIEEIQPSRHRVTLPLAGRTQDEVFAGISKSTRQRIRKAEDAGHSAWFATTPRRGPEGPGDGFATPSEPPEPALDRFYDLLLETGERRHFTFGPRERSSAGGRRRSRPATWSTSRPGGAAVRPSPA